MVVNFSMECLTNKRRFIGLCMSTSIVSQERACWNLDMSQQVVIVDKCIGTIFTQSVKETILNRFLLFWKLIISTFFKYGNGSCWLYKLHCSSESHK